MKIPHLSVAALYYEETAQPVSPMNASEKARLELIYDLFEFFSVKSSVLILNVNPGFDELLDAKKFTLNQRFDMALKKLNEKINKIMFEILKPQKEVNDQIFNTINGLGNLYVFVLILQRLLGKIDSNEIKQIQNATYLESEKKILEEFSPHNFLVVFFIFQFFFSIKFSSLIHPFEVNFANLLKNCLKYLMLIKVAHSISKEEERNEQEYFVALLKNQALSQMYSLRINQSFLLPGGWVEVEVDTPEDKKLILEGHFMLYLIKRLDEESYEKIRINTHALNEENHLLEREIIQIQDMKEFISDIVDLQIKNHCSEIFKKLQSSEAVFEVGRQYSTNLDTSISKGLVLEGQNTARNCTFMACMGLFQHLLKENKKTSQEIVEQFDQFRDIFRVYLDLWT